MSPQVATEGAGGVPPARNPPPFSINALPSLAPLLRGDGCDGEEVALASLAPLRLGVGDGEGIMGTTGAKTLRRLLKLSTPLNPPFPAKTSAPGKRKRPRLGKLRAPKPPRRRAWACWLERVGTMALASGEGFGR